MILQIPPRRMLVLDKAWAGEADCFSRRALFAPSVALPGDGFLPRLRDIHTSVPDFLEELTGA